MSPKLPAPSVELGGPKLGWLKMFTQSDRNCSSIRSLTLMVLARDMLKTFKYGPRSVFRPLLPNVPDVAEAYAAVLNQEIELTGDEDTPVFGLPTRLGNHAQPLPQSEKLLFTELVIVNGFPLWMSIVPLICHPPMAAFYTALPPLAYVLPLPKGKS